MGGLMGGHFKNYKYATGSKNAKSLNKRTTRLWQRHLWNRLPSGIRWIVSVDIISLCVSREVPTEVGVITCRCKHGTAAEYLTKMFTSVIDDPGRRHLRLAACGDIFVPRTSTKTLRRRSFAVYAPVVWNGLPTFIRNIELSLNWLRQELKTFYFRRAYLRDQARSWRPPDI